MGLKPAGFSKRLFAYNIDLSILMIFFLPIYIVIDESYWFFILISLITIMYFSLMESSSLQATLGKKIAGLAVVKGSGDAINFLYALLRTVVKLMSVMVLFISMVMVYLRKDKRSLHDFLLGTLVIEKAK